MTQTNGTKTKKTKTKNQRNRTVYFFYVTIDERVSVSLVVDCEVEVNHSDEIYWIDDYNSINLCTAHRRMCIVHFALMEWEYDTTSIIASNRLLNSMPFQISDKMFKVNGALDSQLETLVSAIWPIQSRLLFLFAQNWVVKASKRRKLTFFIAYYFKARTTFNNK